MADIGHNQPPKSDLTRSFELVQWIKAYGGFGPNDVFVIQVLLSVQDAIRSGALSKSFKDWTVRDMIDFTCDANDGRSAIRESELVLHGLPKPPRRRRSPRRPVVG